MPMPDNREALQRFLGRLNYLHEFIEDYNEKTVALLELLSKCAKWCWEAPQHKVFETHEAGHQHPTCAEIFNFDPTKPVKMSVDESKSGLGTAFLLGPKAPSRKLQTVFFFFFSSF